MSSRSTARPSLCYHPQSRTPSHFLLRQRERAMGGRALERGRAKGGERASAAEWGVVSREGCPSLLVRRLTGG